MKTFHSWCCFTTALLVTICSSSLVDGQQIEKVAEVEGITEYRLDNGAKVLLFPDDSKPQFTLNMTVLVGSRHEGYGESGMAHLLEHMLFRGTDRHRDIPKLLKDRGVLNMNGTTSIDRRPRRASPSADDTTARFGRTTAPTCCTVNTNRTGRP